jgi:hypothetical protein
MRRLALLACAAALAIPAGSATAAGGGSGAVATAAGCSTVSYGGHAYVLYRHGAVKCRFARRWVKRLHRSGGARKPKGWTCSSGTGYSTGGSCHKGKRLFGWHPGD